MRFLTSISNTLGASRLKLWSDDHTVLWSDTEYAIGEQFLEDAFLVEALDGTPQPPTLSHRIEIWWTWAEGPPERPVQQEFREHPRGAGCCTSSAASS